MAYTFRKRRTYPVVDCSGTSHATIAIFSIQRMRPRDVSILEKQLQLVLCATDIAELFTTCPILCKEGRVFLTRRRFCSASRQFPHIYFWFYLVYVSHFMAMYARACSF
jgi:hypothetical protein